MSGKNNQFINIGVTVGSVFVAAGIGLVAWGLSMDCGPAMPCAGFFPMIAGWGIVGVGFLTSISTILWGCLRSSE